MDGRKIEVVTHDSPVGRWESARAAPDARLSNYVLGYEGYAEDRMAFSRRLQIPGALVPLIINFGAPYRVLGPGNIDPSGEYRSFVAGMMDAHVVVEATGLANGVQVNLTPIGARLLLAMPMHELTARTIDLVSALGITAERLMAQLEDTPGWQSRFDILDAFFLARLAVAEAPHPSVVWAWDLLTRSNGRIDVNTIANEIGWSRKHLAHRFREQIGLPPKTMARMLRFNRAVRLLHETPNGDFSNVAYGAGYYDQAHFNHDFRSFSGYTPSEYRARVLPNGGGVLG